MLPLSGVRVLDMTRILAGPFCTMMLGDLGADVIKVEHISRGDDTRSWGPPFSAAGEQSSYFLGVNRNKKSIAVDLKHADAKHLIARLAARSDIVVENFVPGKADELGVGWEALRAVNKKLVFASISGYGSDGPRRDQLAYDVMVSAIGGLMGITGPTGGGEPCKVGVAITDVCAGLVTHGAVLAAYIAALRTGEGQWLETSLFDTQIAALANVASAYLVAGAVTQPQGTAHGSIAPYQAYRCSDASIIVGALNDGQFRRLCTALELPELPADERFGTNPRRVANRVALNVALEARLLRHPAAETLALLDSHSVPCAPINTIAQTFSDPQVTERGRVVTVEHPTVGILKMVAPPVTYHGTPLNKFLPPPLLGQHTRSVLTDVLGCSAEDIDGLIRKGVVSEYVA